jgi:hypothetical protein
LPQRTGYPPVESRSVLNGELRRLPRCVNLIAAASSAFSVWWRRAARTRRTRSIARSGKIRPGPADPRMPPACRAMTSPRAPILPKVANAASISRWVLACKIWIRAFLLERGVDVRQGLRFLRAELPRILATPCDALSPRVHIHGAPTGDAAELKIRPTTTPSASTSKSSSFHSPEGREDRALLRINWVTARVLI